MLILISQFQHFKNPNHFNLKYPTIKELNPYFKNYYSFYLFANAHIIYPTAPILFPLIYLTLPSTSLNKLTSLFQLTLLTPPLPILTTFKQRLRKFRTIHLILSTSFFTGKFLQILSNNISSFYLFNNIRIFYLQISN